MLFLPTSPIAKRQRQQRRQWQDHEDELLRHVVATVGHDWTAVSQQVPNRTGKQCRERWHNHLAPQVNKAEWTVEEDHLLAELHTIFGNAWSEISKAMPGRTDNAVKNRWNTWLRHQLKDDGLDIADDATLAPEAAQMIKLTSLLHTNPHSSLTSLVTEQVDLGLDALVGLVEAKSRREFQHAAAILKFIVAPAA